MDKPPFDPTLMGNKRKYKRRYFIYFLEVYDDANDKFLGHCIDISYQGMMLMSRQPIPVNQNFKLRIQIPGENDAHGSEQTIRFEAESIWSSNEYNPLFHDTGFQIKSLDDDIIKKIFTIVEMFGFRD